MGATVSRGTRSRAAAALAGAQTTGPTTTTTMVGGMGLLPVDQTPGVYEALDKGLEYVQGMCEHAAHQFLRDGDCSEEIANVKRRLAETKETADREMERVAREEPDLLRDSLLDESGAARPPRRLVANPMMRREQLQQAQQSPTTATPGGAAAGKQKELGIATLEAAPLEVDEGIEADDAPEEYEIPKLMYRSTRELRRR